MGSPVTIEIKRPVAVVFEFLADVRNEPRWRAERIEGVRKVTEGPIGPGTTFLKTAWMGGRRVEARSEITRFEPDRALWIDTAAGSFRARLAFDFESPRPGAARVTVDGSIWGGGLIGLVAKPVTRLLASREARSVRNVKRLIETPTDRPPVSVPTE